MHMKVYDLRNFTRDREFRIPQSPRSGRKWTLSGHHLMIFEQRDYCTIKVYPIQK